MKDEYFDYETPELISTTLRNIFCGGPSSCGNGVMDDSDQDQEKMSGVDGTIDG